MKEFFAKIFAVLFSLFLSFSFVGVQNVKALEWVSLSDTILGNPLGGVLNGESVGNQNSFSVQFDLSKFTDNLSIIDNVSLSFFVGNAISSDLQIVDNFDNEVLNTHPLNSVGITYLRTYKDIIANWLMHPEENKGLTFKSNNLSPSSRVNISAISLDISYKVVDNIPPQIISQKIMKGGSNDNYIIELETDEPTKVDLNYGKTSQYTEHRYLTTDNTYHKFDLYFLDVGYSYHYQLVIKDKAGNILTTPDSSFITGLNLLNPIEQGLVNNPDLLAPTELIVEISSTDTKKGLMLSFLPSESENVGGYVVFRRAHSESDFQEIVQLDKQTFNYFDTDIDPGVTYYYKVKTMYGSEVSNSSKEVSFAVPKDFNNQNSFDWNDSRGNVLLALFSIALFVVLVIILLIRFGRRSFDFLFPKKTVYKNRLRDPDEYFTD